MNAREEVSYEWFQKGETQGYKRGQLEGIKQGRQAGKLQGLKQGLET